MREVTDVALEGIRLGVKKAHEQVNEAEGAEEGVFLAARAA